MWSEDGFFLGEGMPDLPEELIEELHDHSKRPTFYNSHGHTFLQMIDYYRTESA